jgi:hypothetical protein
MQVITVPLTIVTSFAGSAPNVTTAPFANFKPVIVTNAPPEIDPADGLMRVTLGTASYVNLSAAVVPLDPPAVDTVTSTTPALPAGAVQTTVAELTTTTATAGVDPNFTVVPVTNPVPVTVTRDPPARGPAAGLTPSTTGAGSYVNLSEGDVALVPPPVETVTSTTPEVPGGAVAAIDVALLTTDVAVTAPNFTVAPLENPEPVMRTDVPPATGPDVGAIDVM